MANIDARVEYLSGKMKPAVREMLQEVFREAQAGGLRSDAELQRRTKSLLYSQAAAANLQPGDLVVSIADVDLGDIVQSLEDVQQEILKKPRWDAQYPIAIFGNNRVPIIESQKNALVLDIQARGGTFEVMRTASVSLGELPELLAEPLSEILSWRLFTSATGAPNVEVTTLTKNWQVIYTSLLSVKKIGFGGPTNGPAPPVSGYVPNGIWKFGISNSVQDKWDSTPWRIPPIIAANPPYKVFLPL